MSENTLQENIQVYNKEENSFLKKMKKRKRERYLKLLKKDGMFLEILGKKYRDDYEMVTAAYLSCGYSLKFASDRIKSDKEFILKLCKEEPATLDDPGVFECLSEEIKNDPDFILKAIQINGIILNRLSEENRADPKLVRLAVKSNGHAWLYASEELKNNPEITLLALKNAKISTMSFILREIGPHMSRDFDFVIKAVSENPAVWQFLNEDIHKNPKVLKTIINNIESKGELSDIDRRHIQCFEEELKKAEEKLDKDELIKLLQESRKETQKYKAEAEEYKRMYEEGKTKNNTEVGIERG